tara:strand:+ start:759 stop:980 length:222 start_codon:yes stop_codon:yes gene_type:complete
MNNLESSPMTDEKSLQWDADRVMEQIIMQESRHMQMSALVSYQLRYPDMTIREFFEMSARELEEQEEELGYYE